MQIGYSHERERRIFLNYYVHHISLCVFFDVRKCIFGFRLCVCVKFKICINKHYYICDDGICWQLAPHDDAETIHSV